jgi:voltage-gated potassium channel
LLIREALAHLGLPASRAEAYLDRFREAMDLPVHRHPSGPDILPELREMEVSDKGNLADQSLREARVRERFGVLVLAIRRADGTSTVTPSPETTLRAGDQVRVFGLPDQLAAFQAALRGQRPEASEGGDQGAETRGPLGEGLEADDTAVRRSRHEG